MHTGLAGFKHRAKKDPLVVDLQPSASQPSSSPRVPC